MILSKYYDHSAATYIFYDDSDTFTKALRRMSYDIDRDFSMVIETDDGGRHSRRIAIRTFNDMFQEHMATRT